MRFLVIGSGIAGLSFALRVADLGEVVVVTKKGIADSATNLAQGGIAAVLDLENDSVASHITDTLTAGAGLCDYKTVSEVVSCGYDRVNDLITYGVEFVKDSGGSSLSLGREGGHSHRRVAHAYDLTGRAIEMTLLDQVKASPSITLLEDHMVVDLLVNSFVDGTRRCAGALVIDSEERIIRFEAEQTVLCTGGTGKVYLYTSNPDIATGDGIAAACRAGARIANMEFVQFHPTCLFHPRAKNFLISEAVRGEGGRLYTRKGVRFMKKYDDRLELATRDTVARSIDQEMKESGDECVHLDISHKDPAFIQARFPAIYKQCVHYGIDITMEPIPVVPAAHYLCGGVLVDEFCNSSIEGLMAIGETACTGLHGANRLASNSLLEAIVFAEKAASFCRQNYKAIENRGQGSHCHEVPSQPTKELNEHILINHNWDVLRRTMWNYVGIVRNSTRLELARERIITITREIENLYTSHKITRNMVELRNIAQVSLLIVESAMLRKESRGLHFTTDYPAPDETQLHWIVLSRDPHFFSWEFSVEYQNFSLAGEMEY